MRGGRTCVVPALASSVTLVVAIGGLPQARPSNVGNNLASRRVMKGVSAHALHLALHKTPQPLQGDARVRQPKRQRHLAGKGLDLLPSARGIYLWQVQSLCDTMQACMHAHKSVWITAAAKRMDTIAHRDKRGKVCISMYDENVMPLRHDWKRGYDDDSIHAAGPFRLQSQNENCYVEQHT